MVMNLGIDFGTSYTKMAYWDNERMTNLLDHQRIPSSATYVPALDKLFFGPLALPLADAESISALFFKLNLKRNPEFSLGQFTLGDILFHFFSFLQKQYLAPLHIRPDSISLSVPNNFGLRARRTLLNAAQNAFALENIILVPEPLAALIGYNSGDSYKKVQGDLLCIDIGGGTTDFSFLSVFPNQEKLLLESQFQIGQDAFSGSEIDRMILRQLLAPAFQMQHGEFLPDHILQEDFHTPEDSYWFQNWMRHAEDLKIAISTRDALQIDFPDFYLDRSLRFDIGKDRFLQAIKPVYERFINYWEEAVRPRARSVGILSGSTWNLDGVVLLGGASQTRGIFDLITALLPGVPVLQSSNPDLNVIGGLTRWADDSLYSGLKLKTVYPFRFYLEKRSGDEHILEEIPFDTANLELDFQGQYEICSIPLDSSFNLARDGDRFHIRVYEVAEEDQNAILERFMDQDLSLELSVEKIYLENPLTLYLNLAKSRLELDNNDLLSWEYGWEDDLLSSLKKKQRAAFDLFSIYKFMDNELIDYFPQEEAYPENNANIKDSSELALKKIHAIINLYKDK